ncbi:class I SAM-dependent methyltransferase [uncultured Winogradskyella sp.]|uniref:THUMP-like domain-containing protein n=1 Tax=uncultured Winogradskyella sp. TaxID=395353 RepID=UPI00262E8733|nr:class I SAM-dependent methyltransferase [uncultured Winogradskyella sp.]
MNSSILNTDVQDYINNNLNEDISRLLLKGISFPNVEAKSIIEQIEAKKRCEKKLPTWYNALGIYFPNKLNIEQTSSEKAAAYKSNLVKGESLIDLTGGFGIDSYYFSKRINNITHCEINRNLSEIVKHNYNILSVKNITCLNESGIDALKRIDKPYDWIYIDPSRRDDAKNKVFLLSDCTPNVKTFQSLFLKYAKNVMIKTSPLLDISATLNQLNNMKTIHIVAINNEVKELLWILEKDYAGSVEIKTVNIQKNNTQVFDFKYEDEPNVNVSYNSPLDYLYEPNASVLKAGAFNSVCNLSVHKLHKHSHLYTSKELMDFPGRQFKIEKIVPFNKRVFSKEKITKANVTTRNFPLSVGDIRKKLKIKDGGNVYLFFTTNIDEEKVILVCIK